MIVLDIESSGLDTGKCGIWQIGAVELENPENQFIEEARIDDEDIVQEDALKVIGKTEQDLRDLSKQSQKHLILNFLEWAKKCETKLIVGHNIGWDLFFLTRKGYDYDIVEKIRKVIGSNGIDTFSVAQLKHLELNKNFALKEDGRGKMGLKRVLKLCGLEDNRKDHENGAITEGEAHNALEDAKLTAECFNRLVYGKSLFEKYADIKVPEELRK